MNDKVISNRYRPHNWWLSLMSLFLQATHSLLWKLDLLYHKPWFTVWPDVR